MANRSAWRSPYRSLRELAAPRIASILPNREDPRRAWTAYPGDYSLFWRLSGTERRGSMTKAIKIPAKGRTLMGTADRRLYRSTWGAQAHEDDSRPY